MFRAASLFWSRKYNSFKEECKTELYIQTLIDGLFRTLEYYDLRADQTDFQQNNATAHTSKNTLKFLKYKKIKTIIWPFNFPDTNIIENLCNKVNCEVIKIKNFCSSEDELWIEIQKGWYNIVPRYIGGFIIYYLQK